MRPTNENRLNETLEYIKNYQNEYGRAPTYRQIKEKIGHSSLCLVNADVNKLRDRGLIEADENGIKTPSQLAPGKTEPVPLVGNVACGEPILAVENIELTANLPVEIFGSGKHMMLRAEGSSMIECGIFSGDILVIRCQSVAEIGQIVVARVDGGYATAKILAKDSKGFFLKPANSSVLENGEREYKDIRPVDEWEIIGIVDHVIHDL